MTTDGAAASGGSDLGYDAFISYSRRDLPFARKLEAALRAYRPPKDLAVPQRYLRVFRDENDFHGPEYRASLERALNKSAKLIVICSPSSASSAFVGEEIELFARIRGKEHIIPVLLDGIPNNEAKEGNADRRAFPDPLVRLLPMPLAADFRGIGARDSVQKGKYASAWFKTLADVYTDYGVDREKIEQRERRRAARRRRTFTTVTALISIVVIGLGYYALTFRRQSAENQRANDAQRLADAARRQAESGDRTAESLVKTILLAVASVRSTPTVNAQIVLTNALDLLARPSHWRHAAPETAKSQQGSVPRHQALAFSADGKLIASASGNGPVLLLDAQSGQTVRSINVRRQPVEFAALAFSPDGARLAVGCANQTCVVDVASGKELARLTPADGRMNGKMWCAVFSADGKWLATSGYSSSVVSVYDTSTWSVSGRIGGQSLSTNAFSLAFSPNGEWLAVGTASSVELWRVGKYDAPAARAPANGIVWSTAFFPDGKSMVTAGNAVQVWTIQPSPPKGIALQKGSSVPPREAQTVVPLVWHGRSCVVSAGDTTRLLCDTDLNEVIRLTMSSVAAVATSPDALSIAGQQRDGAITLWPLDSGIETAHVNVGGPVVAMALQEQKGWFAAAIEKGASGAGGEIVVLDINTWRERNRLPSISSPAALSASVDGRWLAAGAASTLRIFDAASWREVKSIPFDTPITSLAFSARDRSLIAVIDETVVAIQPQDWSERLRVTADKQGDLRAVRLSPDGGLLMTMWHYGGGHDAGVEFTRVFDLQGAKEIGWEYGAPGGSSISQDAAERRAAAANRQMTGGDLKVVAESKSWPLLERTRSDEVTSGDDAWSVKISGSSLEAQDKKANRVIGTVRHRDEVAGAFFLPSSSPRWIVSGARDGFVSVWPLRLDELADQACARLAALDGDTLNSLATQVNAGQPCTRR